MVINMPDIRKLRLNLSRWFSKDLQIRLIVILGILGMALILISQFISAKRPEKTENPETPQTAVGYASELEDKLTALIGGMEGTGRTRVMVTLENAGETVYAQEEKRNVDKQQEPASVEASGKVSQKENVEQKYIIVDGKNGREALVKTTLEPRIQGVVVLCEGAENASVERDIIHVVTTALNIPTTRVCVVKISK